MTRLSSLGTTGKKYTTRWDRCWCGVTLSMYALKISMRLLLVTETARRWRDHRVPVQLDDVFYLNLWDAFFKYLHFTKLCFVFERWQLSHDFIYQVALEFVNPVSKGELTLTIRSLHTPNRSRLQRVVIVSFELIISYIFIFALVFLFVRTLSKWAWIRLQVSGGCCDSDDDALDICKQLARKLKGMVAWSLPGYHTVAWKTTRWLAPLQHQGLHHHRKVAKGAFTWIQEPYGLLSLS